MPTYDVPVRDNTIELPEEIRQLLNVGDGDELLLQEENGEVRLTTRRARLRAVQAWFRTLVPEGESVVDDFIAEKRAEARRELEEGNLSQ